MTDYLYYIGIDSMDSISLKINSRPIIRKVNKNSDKKIFKLLGKEFEGPYISLKELKNKSEIYSQITSLKTKQSILNPKNIKEIEEIILIPFEQSYSPNFIKLFLHAWIGKLNRNDISGVHFYTPENTKIIKVLKNDFDTGVYQAMISFYNKEKKIWIDKSNPTNFFPDSWTLQKLFKELDTAFRNKTLNEGSVYFGYTSEKIKVKIIIKNGNALTMFPIIQENIA